MRWLLYFWAAVAERTHVWELDDPGLDPGAVFTDFDCWSTKDQWPHDLYTDLYDLSDSLMALRELVVTQGEEAATSDVLHATGVKHLASLLGYSLDEDTAKQLQQKCAYGLLPLQLAQWVVCQLTAFGGAAGVAKEHLHFCEGLHVDLGKIFSQHYFPTLLNSRWMRPFCGIQELFQPFARLQPSIERIDPDSLVRVFYDCLHLPEGIGSSGTNWAAFLQALSAEGNGRLSNDWYLKSLRFTFAPGKTSAEKFNLAECPLGFILTVLEKLVVAQSAITEDYAAYHRSFLITLSRFEDFNSDMRNNTLFGEPRDSLSALMITNWPVLPMLCMTAERSASDAERGGSGKRGHGYQYKPFSLDFAAHEIVRPRSEWSILEDVQQLEVEKHGQHLHRLWGLQRSNAYATLIAALLGVLETWRPGAGGVLGTKVVLVSMVWGQRLSRYLKGQIQRAQAFGLHRRLVVFCLDLDALEICQLEHVDRALCVQGQLQTIFNKYTILSAIVNLGFDVLYLDFDTLLLNDPLPLVLEAAKDHELLVSRDFGAECLNTGVIFLKAHPDIAQLLSSLLVWLWHHPYEFSQKAFSAFLRHEKSTNDGIEPLPIKKVPRWTVLDPMNAFVTSIVYSAGVEGWTGNLEGIVVFHFLDGTGGVDEERAVEGRYLNLYDLFYDNPKLDLTNLDVPLWVQDPRVEQVLMRSRNSEVPQELQKCVLLADFVK
eukprot:TRINITY_DN26279_c0_g1_i1.p1 TRINITY_DN26279_c0_g1~~TRINITY_DN26279_c0_g1_i1.p1  ORF type:complete len:722 (-),score=141.28 TRINITY_DN26279_c0_g1_i1:120-2258(-)